MSSIQVSCLPTVVAETTSSSIPRTRFWHRKSSRLHSIEPWRMTRTTRNDRLINLTSSSSSSSSTPSLDATEQIQVLPIIRLPKIHEQHRSSIESTPLSFSSTPRRKLSKLRRRQLAELRRNHLRLYILTSDEHRIRPFSLNGTHGMLIHCNEIRRRQLRELIFAPRKLVAKIEASNDARSFTRLSTMVTTIISVFVFVRK